MAGSRKSGRKKKPVAAKKLAGTHRKDRDSESIAIEATALPPIPQSIHPEAKKEWQRLAPICQKAGLLTGADWMAWTSGFMCWSVVLYAWETMNDPDLWEMKFESESGKEYRQVAPKVSIFKQNLSAFMAFCREFGLTPSSRNGLEIDTGKGNTKDPMSNFLNE